MAGLVPRSSASAAPAAGLQVGAELTDFIFVLNNDSAVRAFSRDGNIKLGAEPPARPPDRWDAMFRARSMSTAAVYTYSRSKGLFAGASLEGAIIATQKRPTNVITGRKLARARSSPVKCLRPRAQSVCSGILNGR